MIGNLILCLKGLIIITNHAALQSFYSSKRWKDFREHIIISRGLTCEHCGGIVAKPKELTLHHIKELNPNNVHDAAISLNPDNVMVVHHKCHNDIHNRFCRQKEKQVYIIYGCPLSGKTTYVRQNKGRNDIVIDIDQLYKAITFLNDYDKPDRLLSNIRRVQNDLLDQVKVRYGKWSCAFIIGGFPDKHKRERLAESLGASLVYVECTREEALARLEFDEHRRYMKAEYEKYIDSWFDRYIE